MASLGDDVMALPYSISMGRTADYTTYGVRTLGNGDKEMEGNSTSKRKYL